MSMISRLAPFVLLCVLGVTVANCTKVPEMRTEFHGVSVDIYNSDKADLALNISKRRGGTVSFVIRIPF